MDWSTVITATTFSGLVDGLTAIVPILLTSLIIPIMILRKGLDLVKGIAYRAQSLTTYGSVALLSYSKGFFLYERKKIQ